MDEDGVLLRRGRFVGGRSGGPTEGEAEGPGVNNVRWGSEKKRFLVTPLGAADIVTVVARDERATAYVRGMLLTHEVDVTLINGASRQVGVAKTGSGGCRVRVLTTSTL